MKTLGVSLLLLFTASFAVAQEPDDLKAHYTKIEYMIPMRDGVKLYTAVYVPKDIPGKHPILLERTPYGSGPYGPDQYASFGGSPKYQKAGYIFASQDVRGQYMSEGVFMNIRPELKPGQQVDESTDTYDSVDFLIKHVPDNNGAVGLQGVSYPGFYAGAGAIHTHPALKAVAPQAPCSDWFLGDDVHHNGAFFLQDNFDFSTWFDVPRPGPEKDHRGIEVDRKDLGSYDFFLKAGALPNLDKLYLHGKIPYWNELMSHPDYDAYWKERSLPQQMKEVRCAVLSVGGWFDAEDMWGPLNLFKATEKLNPQTPTFLVMGPWFHGMWAWGPGRTFGDLDFEANTADYYRDNIEFPFFEHYLRGQAIQPPAKATVFQTGVNKWRSFPEWPPTGLGTTSYYLEDQHGLAQTKPQVSEADSYVNDPAHPTPYIANRQMGRRPTEYMIDDQRWAAKRNDVVTFESEPLTGDFTIAGPIDVHLWASTSGTDADFIVKVIDVWPGDSKVRSRRGTAMAGYEQLLRGDVMRGKYRSSYEKPEPFAPDKPTLVQFKMNDVLHTFLKGHRLMVQVQSDWFPLIDRNPNQFEDIYQAKDEDFKAATIKIYHDPAHPSSIGFGILQDGK